MCRLPDGTRKLKLESNWRFKPSLKKKSTDVDSHETYRHCCPTTDVSLEFYKAFDFKVHKDQIEQGPFVENILGISGASLRTVKLKSETSEVLVELIDYQCGKAADHDNKINNVGLTHFAVQVENLDSVHADMTRACWTFFQAPKYHQTTCQIAFCKASEGTFIELVELLDQ